MLIETLLILGTILGVILGWATLGAATGCPVEYIRDFDEWRNRVSRGKFDKHFAYSSEAAVAVSCMFWPIGIFVLLYHLISVDWTKEQRKLYKSKIEDEREEEKYKKAQALQTLKDDAEKERQERITLREREAGIKP